MEKAGLSLERDSKVVPSRMPSSESTTIVLVSFVLGSIHSTFGTALARQQDHAGREAEKGTLTLTGTISALNLPSFWALDAFANELAAKRS